ncbi:MAG: hypothetical protein ACR2OD_09765 [Gaiellaceae bacterium]
MHALKQAVVLEHAARYGLGRLIETGTWRGDMVASLQHSFRRIDSIELAPALHEAAVRRFECHGHIHVHLGASEDVLPEILAGLREPAIFWLDGHFSGGDTAKGATDTPIAHELDHVLEHGYDHAILIDDARHFAGVGDYPTVEALESLVTARRPEYAMESKDDIIRFLP